MSYYELWSVLSSWRTEFSSGEFAKTFASPDPRKVLHDMAKKGLLKHLGYGKYKVIPADDYVRTKNDVGKAYDLLKTVPYPYALTGVDAVFVWTRGGYNVGRFFGFYPIHLKVAESDVAKWKRFFRSKSAKSFRVDMPVNETIFGVFYLLYPARAIKRVTIEGLDVESLAKTVRFCKKNIYTYEPALEMLDDEFKLGLGFTYSG